MPQKVGNIQHWFYFDMFHFGCKYTNKVGNIQLGNKSLTPKK